MAICYGYLDWKGSPSLVLMKMIFCLVPDTIRGASCIIQCLIFFNNHSAFIGPLCAQNERLAGLMPFCLVFPQIGMNASTQSFCRQMRISLIAGTYATGMQI